MKTAAQWEADEQKLMQLQKWRKELKCEEKEVSKQIHILSTSISQHKKKARKHL